MQTISLQTLSRTERIRPKKVIDRSSISMKPPAKKGKRGELPDWPRDLAEKVPVSPYFCPVLNEKSHK